jgi:hypothetical protein
LRGGGAALNEGLDFGDLAIGHLEAQGDHGGRFPFADAAQERDLAGLDVGDEKAVGSRAVHGVPKPVAEVELLAVFGELGVFGDGRLGGIVGQDRVEVTIDNGFQTGAVAGAGLRLRGQRASQQDS